MDDDLLELADWLDGFARQCCSGPLDRTRLSEIAEILRWADEQIALLREDVSYLSDIYWSSG
jgi:hypothetical protein